MHRLDKGNLLTVLDLAGTSMPVQVLDDVVKMVDLTTRWFVLGQAQPAHESFQRGLSVLGVLVTIKVHPKAFRSVLCHEPKQITAEIMENSFTFKARPDGSTKAVTKPSALSLAWLSPRYRGRQTFHSPKRYFVLCQRLWSLTTSKDLP